MTTLHVNSCQVLSDPDQESVFSSACTGPTAAKTQKPSKTEGYEQRAKGQLIRLAFCCGSSDISFTVFQFWSQCS